MAKLIVLLASALCFATLFNFASSSVDDYDRFHIEGRVYCDTCRVQFVTRLSKFLEGAKVKLECKHKQNGTVTLTREAVTDKSGKYQMDVMGDYEEDECEITLIESPDKDCSDISKDELLQNAARVGLSAHDGQVSNETRIVNPLGFMKKKALPDCPQAFKELGIVPDIIF